MACFVSSRGSSKGISHKSRGILEYEFNVPPVGFCERVKALKTLVHSLACPYMMCHSPMEVYCRLFVAYHLYDLQQPKNVYISIYTKSFYLERSWSADGPEETIEEDIRDMKPCFEESASCVESRRVFKSPEGYVRLAPHGAHQVDALCVLLY